MARWVDATSQERTKSYARKDQAEAHIRQVTTDLVTGTYVDSARSAVTFAVVAEEWFAMKRGQNRTKATLGGYRSVLDTKVLPRWGDMKLTDITHADIQQWVTWMTTSEDARQLRTQDLKRAKRKPLSPSSTHKAYGQLKQVLAFAIRSKRLAINPADDVELPSVSASRREDMALTHAQVRALAEGAREAGPIVLALAYTGMRFGELAALRVRAIDLDKRRIVLKSGVTQVTGMGLVEGNTKAHQTRSAPILTDELADLLMKAMVDKGLDAYVFPGPDGGPMYNHYFRTRFDWGCKAAGLTGATPKTLRHSAGSLALQLGASVTTVQKLLGHKNAHTTMTHYAHMLPDDFDNLAEKMNAAAVSAAGEPINP
ncbi:hypothetical protein AWB85_24990 [Mycobacteroides immunogenum]|uniref:Integrase n=1 Tax=Mycobacteroides immunogenum TaxID=83262 RepID=A0A179V9A6_9MYCO|nr:hypothetical protein AWB85_24990 [Mycobacteroides immunogenum]